eukprot:CAMPEP_0201682396 /NCGR_PEP_ID=MMETSP0494-20130426/51598_1 /ASSEMBLY_ACC=CAM_ASM_000839 /TAXON_ID=420259 /ORGANISM="Thalassiosira gravida, Strain GMp14c1" /LENGTH=564 /DNA_ID=CAMNT_0048166153 /DNA_START=107 /DNA_END=1801 /DNA_ORIENTATION=-
MIPGLEYEQSAPTSAGATTGDNSHATSATTASDPSYSQSPQTHNNDQYHLQQQQLHRRRPHTSTGYTNGNNNGYNNGANGSSGGSGKNNLDDDKYTKRTTRAVRKLDFFPKTERDYTVRTERGGQLTAVGYCIMAILILSEWMAWRGSNGESLEHIAVDTSLGKRMRVNLNITFPALHCNDVHLDVIDVAGDSQIDLSDKMYKQRIDTLTGKPKSKTLIAAEANSKADEDRKRREALDKKIPADYCGPCYGAQEKDGDCCNTCDEVMAAYKKKRWNENAVQPLAEQCIREGRGKNEPKKMTKNGEGCNLSGQFTVNRVAGNFHVAMGEGVEREGRHIHQFLPEDRVNFNASHVINDLTFLDDEFGDLVAEGVGFQMETNNAKKKKNGGINGEKSMNGVDKLVTEETGTTGLFQYFIKVVPTKYKGDIIDDLGVPSSSWGDKKEKILETNRYFYTERFRPLIGEVHEEAILSGDPDRGMAGAHVGGKSGGTLHEKMGHHDSQNAVLPGVFFVYEIYPFAVEITKNTVPFMHLFVRIMATVGGVFTLMSLLDGVLYSREKKGGRRS